MSKVMKLFSLAVPLLLLVGAARADVLVFPDIEATEKALRHNTWMTDDGVQSRLLAQVACQNNIGKSVMSKYPKLYQSDGACVDLFLARNNIRSAVITPEEFRAKAKGGWWLPTNSDVAGNGDEVQGLSKQLVATQQRVGKLEEGGQAAVQSLKGEMDGQLAAVKRQVADAKAKSANAQTAINNLKGELDGVKGKLAGVTTLNHRINETDGQISGINQQVSGLKDEVGGLSDKVDAMKVASLPIGYMATKYTFGDGVAESYANHRGLVYTAFVMLFIGVAIVLPHWLQRQTNRKVARHERQQDRRLTDLDGVVFGFDDNQGGLLSTTNRLHGGQIRLDNQVKDLTKTVEEQGRKMQELQTTQARTAKVLTRVAETANDALSLATASAEVVFDPANPGLEVLEQLPVGREHSVAWKGTFDKSHFVIDIWKEPTTPKGQVQTNIVRNSQSGQLSEPMALKRLRQRVTAAVIDGRVPLIMLVESKPVLLLTESMVA